MTSIITAIYNQLDMNRLFYESLCRTTDGGWELIIIDNGSTDGSREYFESLGGNVRVIRNDGNYSYPYCQNQGIATAKGDILAFLNNDILLSPHWDSRVRSVIGRNGYEAITLASNDRSSSAKRTRRLRHRWKRIKYPLTYLFGQSSFTLKAMAWLMYGNWERYAEKEWKTNGGKMALGFSGSAVIMTRRALALVGEWDPTLQGADFDLYARSMARHESHGDIQPLSVATGIVHHHYGRLTFGKKYPPFKDAANLRRLEDKWDSADLSRWLKTLKE